MSNVARTTKPKLDSARTRFSGDAKMTALIDDVSANLGHAVTMQDESGRAVPVRINSLTAKQEYFTGGKWVELKGSTETTSVAATSTVKSVTQTNAGLDLGAGVTTVSNLIDNGLAANAVVMTDGSMQLVTRDYLDQSVKQASSPTFASLALGSLSIGMGAQSSSALAVGDNNTLVVATNAGSGQLGRVGINGSPQAQRFEITHGHLRFNLFAAPGTACTATLAGVAGVVDPGSHVYFITYVTAEGETDFSPASNAVTTSAANGKVNLSGIPCGLAGVVTARKIYRSKTGNGNTGYYLATIADNNTTTYSLDNALDSSLTYGQYFGYIPNTTAGKIFIGAIKCFEANKSSVYIGNSAGGDATSGLVQSIAIGQNALLHMTSGANVIAIGVSAVESPVSGSNVIGIGYQACKLTTGTRNLGIGINALLAMTSSTCSVGVGGMALTRATGGDHTAFGDYAGADITTGARTLCLGRQAGYNAGTAITVSDAICLGYNSIPTASNQIMIGSLSAYGYSSVVLNGKTNTDITLTFAATTNSGILSWVYASDYFKFSDDIMLNDGENLIFGTSTGSKIGTLGGASGQKLGFWNATPIVQPVLATGASHTVDDIITMLQTLGLCRQS